MRMGPADELAGIFMRSSKEVMAAPNQRSGKIGCQTLIIWQSHEGQTLKAFVEL